MSLAGQVWTSLDKDGIAGISKGMVWLSGNVRNSFGGAGHTHNRVATEPALKGQPGAD